MAFPTTGLSDNQVHKEGNRAFVYDSTLGTWDQVRETDRAENKFLSGAIGGNVTFPTYHIIHYDIKYDAGARSTTSNGFVEVDSNLRITHTGAHTDNIFLFEFSTAGMSCSGNQMFTSVANINAITTMLTEYNSCDYNDTTKVPATIRSYISASTSTGTYTPIFRNQNGSTTVHIGGMGSVSNYTFSLTELKKV